MKKLKLSFLLLCGLMLGLSATVLAQMPGMPQLYDVTLEIVGQGSVTVEPGPYTSSATYTTSTILHYGDPNRAGINVDCTATPDMGWQFDRWELGPVGNLNTTSSTATVLALVPGGSNPSNWTLTAVFTPHNNAPVAVADAYGVNEGATLTEPAASGVLTNDTDADAGDTLTASKVTDPTNGTLTLNADGSFVYVHDGSETTTDSFTYKANDGTVDSNVATVTITITPQNDPPVITGQVALTTPEETALPIALDDLTVSDPDNTYPADFTLSVQDGTDYSHTGNTITPDTDVNGPLAVPVTVTDGQDDSNEFSLTVTVTAVNDPPVITGQVALTTPEETALPIALSDLTVTDPDNTYPTGFTLSVQDGTNYSRTGNTITPDTGFTGTLTVPVMVNDGTDDSNVFDLDVAVEAAAAKTLGTGWHMISVPRVAGDASPATVFHDVIESGQSLYLYEWVPGSSYNTPTTIDPGKGYWLYVSDPVTVNVNGTSLTGDYHVTLGLQGWHQVSTPRWPVSWAAVQFTYGGETKVYTDAVTAGWISSYVFWYNETEGTYEVADSASGIDPWMAYWMRTYVDNLVMILPLDQAYASVMLGTEATIGLMSLSKVLSSPPPPPSVLAAPVGRLRFANTPNPIRDVHTTTFVVKGLFPSMVQAIKVEIYDQAGQLVYASGEVPGTSLEWHTDSEHGELLSNGVYLYRMYASVNVQWVVSDINKLAIMS